LTTERILRRLAERETRADLSRVLQVFRALVQGEQHGADQS
jgi:hypothetical protein